MEIWGNSDLQKVKKTRGIPDMEVVFVCWPIYKYIYDLCLYIYIHMYACISFSSCSQFWGGSTHPHPKHRKCPKGLCQQSGGVHDVRYSERKFALDPKIHWIKSPKSQDWRLKNRSTTNDWCRFKHCKKPDHINKVPSKRFWYQLWDCTWSLLPSCLESFNDSRLAMVCAPSWATIPQTIRRYHLSKKTTLSPWQGGI